MGDIVLCTEIKFPLFGILIEGLESNFGKRFAIVLHQSTYNTVSLNPSPSIFNRLRILKASSMMSTFKVQPPKMPRSFKVEE